MQPNEQVTRTGYVRAYQNRFRNRLIRLLGGPDPVFTAMLVHKANNLASIAKQYGRFNTSLAGVVESQVKGIRRATFELDPMYAIIRGYERE